MFEVYGSCIQSGAEKLSTPCPTFHIPLYRECWTLSFEKSKSNPKHLKSQRPDDFGPILRCYN